MAPRSVPRSLKVLFSLDRFNLKGIQGSTANWQEFGIWMNNRLLNGVSEIPRQPRWRSEIWFLVKIPYGKSQKVYQYMQEQYPLH